MDQGSGRYTSGRRNGVLCTETRAATRWATHMITGLWRSDPITDMLASLHWLRSSERIQYKLATTLFRSLHGLAAPYLSDDLHRLVDIPSRRRLRSASSLQLDMPRTRRRNVGDWAFAAAGLTIWNSLPHDITDCVSLTSFCRKLKTFLFSVSFPWLHFSF